MGYCVDMTESTISITRENSIKMMDMLIKYINENKPKWDWVDTNYVKEECVAYNFHDVMAELRWTVYMESDSNNDVLYYIDYFSGEKLGSEWDIFKILAPYINDGYIEMCGEDGNKWRYVFKDGKCDEKYPNVSWK